MVVLGIDYVSLVVFSEAYRRETALYDDRKSWKLRFFRPVDLFAELRPPRRDRAKKVVETLTLYRKTVVAIKRIVSGLERTNSTDGH